ncbi:MAG: hypothetical protein WAK17_00335 [Candidatus Nitrosopolaris sp.]|jgi:integrase
MVAVEETASDLGIKIEQATRGLTPSFSKRLSVLSSERASVICDYILALRSEIRLSDNYRMSILNTLIPLSIYGNNKRFKDFTRADIIRYLDHFRKDDNADPSHKWVGTYNGNLINVVKFFRWLYNPDVGPTDRPRPSVVQNLSKLKRLEISLYKPDMWTSEENLLFLKYCPSARDRCFHAIQVDIGCRPHEILKLRIKDLEFKEGDNGQRYAEIVVNGKTGERGLPLIDSIPYITQWISLHPQGSNREAILVPNERNGKAIQAATLIKTYKHYKSYFTELLSRQDVPQEDKQRINELLRKKWNPYVHRHSTVTHKYDTGEISSDAKMKQFFGWTPRSNMLAKYVHFRGNEAKKDLLRTKGLLRDEKVVNILEPKMCPHCREPNRPDAQFCFKCNFVMSFEAYHKGTEEKERKDQELQALRNEILETKAVQQKREDEMQVLKEHMAKMEESQLKITELLEVMKIAKSSDGKVGKDRTMLDEKRRVTIGYVDNNNQSVEMKVPVDGFETE